MNKTSITLDDVFDRDAGQPTTYIGSSFSPNSVKKQVEHIGYCNTAWIEKQ
jgi:hypothetical protein